MYILGILMNWRGRVRRSMLCGYFILRYDSNKLNKQYHYLKKDITMYLVIFF